MRLPGDSGLTFMLKYFRKGWIYFPDFCELVLGRFRQSEEEEEDFFQTMFKVREMMDDDDGS